MNEFQQENHTANGFRRNIVNLSYFCGFFGLPTGEGGGGGGVLSTESVFGMFLRGLSTVAFSSQSPINSTKFDSKKQPNI